MLSNAGDSVLIPHYDQSQTLAVAFDLSPFGKIVLTGKDRAPFLQNFTTNDVIKPGTGSGCETFLTTPQAKVVAWLRVALREHDYYINFEPGLATRVIQHLEKFIISEDVQFEDRTSSDFLYILTGPSVPTLLADFGVGFQDWKLWQNAELNYQDTSFWIQRCDYLGHASAFVWGDRSSQAILDKSFADHGVPLLSLDEPLWATLRVETATPYYGVDLDETFLPQEANRTEQCISFTKGCYIGQETVARIRAYGHVNRQLIRVKFTEPLENPGSWIGAVVTAQGKEVGKLKSVAYSPKSQAVLAFGLIRKEHLKAGTELLALGTDGHRQRTVVTI